MIIQLFVPCYYATLLFYKSNNLTNALFHSNWLKQSLIFKRMMIIFLQAVHRPITIVAGRMFTLNLTTFLSVRYIYYYYLEQHNFVYIHNFFSLCIRLSDWRILCMLCFDMFSKHQINKPKIELASFPPTFEHHKRSISTFK